jgi:hypothetical protein
MRCIIQHQTTETKIGFSKKKLAVGHLDCIELVACLCYLVIFTDCTELRLSVYDSIHLYLHIYTSIYILPTFDPSRMVNVRITRF